MEIISFYYVKLLNLIFIGRGKKDKGCGCMMGGGKGGKCKMMMMGMMMMLKMKLLGNVVISFLYFLVFIFIILLYEVLKSSPVFDYPIMIKYN